MLTWEIWIGPSPTAAGRFVGADAESEDRYQELHRMVPEEEHQA